MINQVITPLQHHPPDLPHTYCKVSQRDIGEILLFRISGVLHSLQFEITIVEIEIIETWYDQQWN